MASDGERMMPGRVAAAVRSCRADLIGFLARRLRCFATAEDLAQEACVRLFQAGAAVRSPRAFLFRVATNLARDHFRVHGRRDELLREAHRILWVEEDEITPERQLVGRDLMERLDAVVAELPEISRRIFQLGYYEGLTQNEISARLGISRTTVKKHMGRVFERLADVQAELAGGLSAQMRSGPSAGRISVDTAGRAIAGRPAAQTRSAAASSGGSATVVCRDPSLGFSVLDEESVPDAST